ncbi:hypothetical protein [Methylocystis heyeri]|uniref:Pectate lyase superfamily protein domain-containing protein n=1 Tax=Methylocystis heyeri TaxID=391905 RepID=A0A6B8KJZ9_9HYPH|nr:hypothetical protein [Methylocystis heyeri]QGM46940.1 hypothetical protein H2LOC_015255 [Methylocystis heyeri]
MGRFFILLFATVALAGAVVAYYNRLHLSGANSTTAPPSSPKPKPTVDIRDFGAKSDGTRDASSACNQATTRVSSAGGGIVRIPAPENGGYYRFDSTCILRQNVTVECDDAAVIKPGAALAELFRIASDGAATLRRCKLINQAPYAVSAISIDPATALNTSDFITIEDMYVRGFANGVLNKGAGGWTIRHMWFQSQTGWDIRSIDNGTNSAVFDVQSLGSAGCISYAKTSFPIEGVQIQNLRCSPVGGVGVRFSGGLNNRMENITIDSATGPALELDGDSGYAVANMQLHDIWLGGHGDSPPGTHGLYAHGAVVQSHFDMLTAALWPGCGIMIKGSPAAPAGDNNISNSNISFSSLADICLDGAAAHVYRTFAEGNTLRSPVSVLETGAAGAVWSTWRHNVFSGRQTFNASSIHESNLGEDLDMNTNEWAAWTRYAPVISCESGAPAEATASAAYTRIKNTVVVEFTVSNAKPGTCAGRLFFSLPFAVNSAFAGYGQAQETSANVAVVAIAFAGRAVAGLAYGDGDYALVAAAPRRKYQGVITYEAAP